jgi:NTE family protein
MKVSYKSRQAFSRYGRKRSVENVLVLQGGGSLGAFSCGVFKALVKEQIKLDIVAGTSIGAINAAIITASKSNNPETDLENFWLELAESSHDIIPDFFVPFNYHSKYGISNNLQRISMASTNAAFFGVPRMFLPRWNPIYMFTDKDYFKPENWTYLYDNTPFVRTLENYIDYRKLDPDLDIENDGNSNFKHNTRLLVTAVNVLTAEPLIFDSAHIPIESKHLLASCGYPNYGFPWAKVQENVYGWDGSLLSNTPVREVIASSPLNDKNIFIVENYSREIDRLPSNMTEVMDRAKDIMFSDKTKHSLKMTKIMTRQIRLIEKLYEYFEDVEKEMEKKGGKTIQVNDGKVDNGFHITNDEKERIRKEYKNLVFNRGSEILSVTRIVRNRMERPNISKNANFSVKAVKLSISEGEKRALQYIKEFKEKNEYNYQSSLGQKG